VTAPWSAPGETAPQPTAPADPGLRHTDQGAAPPALDRPPLPQVPLPMRPMTIPDLLDGAFAILKLRARDVLTLGVLFVVPIEVISTILLRDVLDEGALSAFGDASGSVAVDDSGAFSGLDATLVSVAISAISLALIAGALSHLVARWYDGEDVSPAEAAAAALRRSPALLVALVVVHLLEIVGLLGIGIGAYVVMALMHVVSPIVVVERLGPFRAVGRSMRLTTTRFGTSLVVPGLVGVIGALVGFGFQLIPELVAAVVPGEWDWLVRGVGQMLSQLVIVPFTAGVAVLYHLDLRIRAEGLDIERRTRAIAAV
jgi:hypothetical protein